MKKSLPSGNYTLSVVTRLQDNGDGGYTLYGYNNNDELLKDHPKADGHKLTEKEKQDILSEDDGYENGYIGQDNIQLKITEDGQILLAAPLNFHAGQ